MNIFEGVKIDHLGEFTIMASIFRSEEDIKFGVRGLKTFH